MRFVQIAGIAAASMALAHAATAQAAPPSPVQRRMRQLMMVEEQYYSDHGSYTTDLAALGLMSKVDRQEQRVWLRVYHAGGAGWVADAQGANGMSGSCVAFVGNSADFASVPVTQGKQLKPTEEGVITCDP